MSARISLALFCFASALAACGPDEPPPCAGQVHDFADEIVDAPGHVQTQSSIDVPDNAVNGVVDGDTKAGGLDVYSRGLSTEPANHYLVLRWRGRAVVNTAGADFVVFENAFQTQGGVFMDPIVVEVSNDGARWVAFPHDYRADDETKYSRSPADWDGFAGVTPVAFRSADCTDPFEEGAGGDRFDLDALPDPELRNGFRFLRLTTAAVLENPDTGEPFPRDVISDGFDLDGVFARATRVD